MLLLLLVCTLSFGISWRVIMIYAGLAGDDWPLDAFAGPLGEAFRPYFRFFPLLAVWHFFDLIESDSNPSRWRGWFAGYRSFFILLILASPFAVLGAIDGHVLRICSNPSVSNEFVFWDHCEPSSFVTFLLYLLFAPLVLVACVSKAITSILSYRRPKPTE